MNNNLICYLGISLYHNTLVLYKTAYNCISIFCSKGESKRQIALQFVPYIALLLLPKSCLHRHFATASHNSNKNERLVYNAAERPSIRFPKTILLFGSQMKELLVLMLIYLLHVHGYIIYSRPVSILMLI